MLKKNGGEIYSGTVKSNEMIEKVVTGGGTYALYLNGSDYPGCTIDVMDNGPTPSVVGNCRFEKTTYSYNEGNVKFIAENVYARNESWTIKKGNTVFASDFGLNKMGETLTASGNNNFKVNKTTAGTYVFTLNNSGKSCSAELKMKQPTVSCKRTRSWSWFSYDYSLKISAAGCENGCTYVVKGEQEDSPQYSINSQTVEFTGFTTGSGRNKRNYTVDGSTQYSVSLNGEPAVSCTNDY